MGKTRKMNLTTSRSKSERKQKTKRKVKRMPNKKINKRTRRMRGGAPLPPVQTYPPGGAYVPGAINGIDGGYYYGLLVNPYLPDPKYIGNLQCGGGIVNYLPWGLRNLTRSSIYDIQKFLAAYRGVEPPINPLPMQDIRIKKN